MVNDVQRSIKSFEGLGFVVEDRWEQDGVLMGIMLRGGDVHIGPSQDDWKKGLFSARSRDSADRHAYAARVT